MRLYVETMDVTVVEVTAEGQVCLDTGERITPSLQERRAIIFAAEQAIGEFQELRDVLAHTGGAEQRRVLRGESS